MRAFAFFRFLHRTVLQRRRRARATVERAPRSWLPAWNNTTAFFGLEQLVDEATRVTKSSATLIDHIYTNNKQQVSKVKVVESGISDHSAIFRHLSIKLPKQNPTRHTTITFRSFKNFNDTNFLFDLNLLTFANVCDHSDPDEALSVWYDTIKPVIDKHAPIQHKRVKATKPCPWLTQELIREMRKRDQLKHNRWFREYKKQRNYVVNLVQKAKNIYFSQLVKDNFDTSSIWKAINSITRKNSKTCDISASNIPPDSFNDHFLSVSTKLLHSLKESSGHDSYICSSSLIDFWKARTLSCISHTTTHCLWSRKAYYGLNKQKIYETRQYTHISA